MLDLEPQYDKMKPLPVKSELPISTPQPRPSSKLLTKRIVLAVVLSLLALVHLVNPQLLFPDQLTLPLRFQEGLRGDESLLDDVSDQRTLRFGEYLDQEGPRIAIIGAGAGGKHAFLFVPAQQFQSPHFEVPMLAFSLSREVPRPQD